MWKRRERPDNRNKEFGEVGAMAEHCTSIAFALGVAVGGGRIRTGRGIAATKGFSQSISNLKSQNFREHRTEAKELTREAQIFLDIFGSIKLRDLARLVTATKELHQSIANLKSQNLREQRTTAKALRRGGWNLQIFSPEST
ncbi:MAG: hypothetical protein HUU46_12850 [Candidatus Hydrogenedentes bacterium]|nr:hypothetical protein [Candidatus Hydrogenedentota bacterium]